jgi:hypothetical protein
MSRTKTYAYASFFLFVAYSLVSPASIPTLYLNPFGRLFIIGLVFIWTYYGTFLLGLLGTCILGILLQFSIGQESMTSMLSKKEKEEKEKKGEKKEKVVGVDLETIKTSLQAQNSKYVSAPPKSISTHPVAPSQPTGQLKTSPIH